MWKTAFKKNWSDFKLFKVYLPQILRGLFLNTLTHIIIYVFKCLCSYVNKGIHFFYVFSSNSRCVNLIIKNQFFKICKIYPKLRKIKNLKPVSLRLILKWWIFRLSMFLFDHVGVENCALIKLIEIIVL